jgi:hypothetical protein
MDKDMQPVMTVKVDEEGDKYWRIDGKIHRTDGPAIEWDDGDFQWCLYGDWISFDTWLKQTNGLTDEEKVMMKLRYG